MKKSYYLILALLICFISQAIGQVQNGTFESWSGNIPTGWTTIDSGIGVSRSTAVVKEGSSSIRVAVNTSTQSATDLRQTISVTPGQPYTFSVWVYQAEVGARARLYVDGYRDYSNSSLINAWQQISYTYTPSSSSIQVGVRFYDVSGFDGSSVIYLDDYKPNSGNSGGGDGGGSSCNETEVTLTLETDNYGNETSWTLKNGSGTTIESGSGYGSNTTYSGNFCLPDGNYTFTINDSYGDGICCAYGSGSYRITNGSTTLVSGGNFGSSESKNFTIGSGSGGGGAGGTGYYADAAGKSGYTLKTALYNIIKNHNSRGYSALWGFYSAYELDRYYENDGSILSMYAEKPSGGDAYSFAKVSDQCGSYSGEGSCYNREHSFPKSWFGGSIEPMYSDVHSVYPADGYVNARRSNYPYGEVGTATYTSSNGSKLGNGASGLGYSGTVFEPIDEFKGDFARTYFYVATRYENVIASWETFNSRGDLVLDGSKNKVFEPWVVNMLVKWHQQDPVSQKEIDRNNAAYDYQGNRNPYIDHPEYVGLIWGSATTRLATATIAQEVEEKATLRAFYYDGALYVSGANGQPLSLIISDMTGRKLVATTITNNQQGEVRLPLYLRTNKAYIVNLLTDTSTETVKIFVK